MQIKYLVSSMIFWWRENKLSFEQDCELLRSLGLGIELWPTIRGQAACRYNRRNWSRLAAATNGMNVSMLSRDDHPSLKQWQEQIQCAEILKASIVAKPEQLLALNGNHQKNHYDRINLDFASEIVKLAQKYNVRLCLETGELATVKQIGDKFDSLSYCLDTGFANLDTVFNFEQYVDQLAPKIRHLHLHDNYGITDDHEPPGLKGGISKDKWQYLLDTLSRYDNEVTCCLEMYPSMPAIMIRQAAEFIFDELKWPDEPKKMLNARKAVALPKRNTAL